MKMTRQVLEEYLDGELPPAQKLLVEQALQTDSATESLLRQLRSERAQRAAIYASYEPTQTESKVLAESILDYCQNAPTGIISRYSWSWKLARIAASIVLTAGAFVAGQYSINQHIISIRQVVMTKGDKSTTPPVISVLYKDASGNTATKEFTDFAEAQKFVQEAPSSQPPDVAIAGGVF
ncbi:MAG: hypothetical protein WCI73_00645 [Phycisphaerae bacterium]